MKWTFTARRYRLPLAFVVVNLLVLGFYGWAAVAPPTSIKTALLPGQTTHGHYQIELDCAACHGDPTDGQQYSATDVLQDACVRCHGDALERANDTHPAKKFNDPTKAALLLVLDAKRCVTCHREHEADQTTAMGVTIASDYCWHCHKEIGESRTSHQGMTFDSCNTAGCHNYHDNRALHEKNLALHHGEPDFFDVASLPARRVRLFDDEGESLALDRQEIDAPRIVLNEIDPLILSDWSSTMHAAAGVNCSGCHQDDSGQWSDSVAMQTCDACHANQVEQFGRGRHGMRIASGMSPLTPAMARLPMRVDSPNRTDSSPHAKSFAHAKSSAHAGEMHRSLTCNACHQGHRFDTQFAAVDACLNCHADDHSLAFEATSHATLWRDEQNGMTEPGSGVSCATCHMPRLEIDGSVTVMHNQNEFLRPSDTMARMVCSHCHGLEFSLSSLADATSVAECFGRSPKQTTASVEMANRYFEERRSRRRKRD